MGEEIRCKKCGKLLAKDKGDVLEIMNNKKETKVYGAVAVSIDCPRCGMTVNLPHKMPIEKM